MYKWSGKIIVHFLFIDYFILFPWWNYPHSVPSIWPYEKGSMDEFCFEIKSFKGLEELSPPPPLWQEKMGDPYENKEGTCQVIGLQNTDLWKVETSDKYRQVTFEVTLTCIY